MYLCNCTETARFYTDMSAGPVQLALPLEAAPVKVRQHGLRAAHPRPLVSLGKRQGRPYSSFRTTPQKAWRFPEVEYGRAGSSIAALVFDCDDPLRWRPGLSDLPPPNWIVRRPVNDHVHVAYCLETPVHRYPAARPEPVRYLANIAEYYQHVLGADAGYTGVLAHNPAPIYRQDIFETTWGSKQPYSLDGLADVIPFGWSPPRVRQTAIGRNCDLFEAGMAWAGRKVNAELPVLPALLVVNQQFEHPLPHGELVSMAKSIERYRRQWAARGWHCPKWIESRRQRGRIGGVRSGEKRRVGSNEAMKPWEAEGVSRRTWYRRRAQARKVALEAYTDKSPEGGSGGEG